MKKKWLDEKQVEVKEGGGKSRLFNIGLMPALHARRVLSLYDANSPRAALLAALEYAETEGRRLDSAEAINSAVEGLNSLILLENAVMEFNFGFFRQRKPLKFIEALSDEASSSVKLQNVDNFIGIIVQEGKASLKELREDYCLEEAFDLWEIIATRIYNDFVEQKKEEKAQMLRKIMGRE